MSEFVSVVRSPVTQGRRTVKKVPFVELAGGRVQGVISSGSDIKRVYVAWLEADTGKFYCCTNNNRPCGGQRADGCKHLHQMINEAMLQFSPATVATYLGLSPDDDLCDAVQLTSQLTMTLEKESPGVVFSRFLSYLRYCELSAPSGSVPEMNWFAS